MDDHIQQPIYIDLNFLSNMKGRNGLGSIYVKSSGDGGRNGDHCSMDQHVGLIYNIAVASAARDHKYVTESRSVFRIVSNSQDGDYSENIQ